MLFRSQIRQFDSNTWYFTGILGVKRWLTPENVQTLSAFSDAIYTPGPTSIHGVNLGSTSQAYALRPGSATPLQVTFPGGRASANNPGNNWSAVAAAPTSTGYALYWRNSVSQRVARWNLDANGVYESGYYLPASQLGSEEASLGFDLNGDGYTVGSSTIAGLNLGSTTRGYALRSGSGAPVQVTYPDGDASANNPGNGWNAVAASPSGTGARLYWRNSDNRPGLGAQVARWELDPSGAYESGMILAPSALVSEEANLNLDLNDDGILAVGLSSNAEGYVLDFAGMPSLQVVYPGGNEIGRAHV